MTSVVPQGINIQLVLGRFEFCRRPFCALVQSDGSFQQLEVYAPSDYFRGSVFGGQIEWNEETKVHRIHVFDVLCVRGEQCGDGKFPQRYIHIQEAFGNNQMDLNALNSAKQGCISAIRPPIELLPKAWLNFTSFGALARSGNVSGFLFLHKAQPVKANTHKEYFILMLKPCHVNLQVADGQLYCLGYDHKLSLVPNAPPLTLTDGIYELTLPHYTFQRHRPDLLRPDHIMHLRQCEAAARDPITVTDILNINQEPSL